MYFCLQLYSKFPLLRIVEATQVERTNANGDTILKKKKKFNIY